MNKNEFAKAAEMPKKRSAWVIAGMTALTVGASIVGPEIVDEIQNETGSNEPRSSVKVKKSASPITKIGDILFDTRSASADAVNTVTDANGENHSFNVSQQQVKQNFTGSGAGFSNSDDGVGSLSGKLGSGSATFTTLTKGAANQSGAIAFNKQLDMTASWTLKFNLNLTKYNSGGSSGLLSSHDSNGAGDFLGLVLAPISPNQLGTSGAGGGALGIGSGEDANKNQIPGIKNAVQWGIDFWQNEGDATSLTNPTDGSTLSTGKDGNQVSGFRTTDGSGTLNTVSGSTGFTSFDKTNGADVMGFIGDGPSSATDSEWEGDTNTNPNLEAPMTATYSYANGVGTLTISADNGKYTATQNITITDGVNSTMSVGFKASDGTKYSQKGVTIKSFDLTLPTADTTVNYQDKSGNTISTSTKIKSNVNDTLAMVTSGASTNPTGTAHTFTPATISGYTYVGTTYGTSNSTSGPLTVSDTDANNIINVQYAKNSKLTTVFVDQNGKVISTVPSVELGTAGTNYDGQKATDAADYTDYTTALSNATKVGYTGAVSGVYSDSGLTTKLGADLSAATFGSSDKTVYVQLTPAAQTATISYTQPDGLNDAGKTALSTAISGSATSLTGVTDGAYSANTIKVPVGFTAKITASAGTVLDTDSTKSMYYKDNGDGTYTIVGAFNMTSTGALTVPSFTVAYAQKAVNMTTTYPDGSTDVVNQNAFTDYAEQSIKQQDGKVSFVDNNKATSIAAGSFGADNITHTVAYEDAPQDAGVVASDQSVQDALKAVNDAQTLADYQTALSAYNAAVLDAQKKHVQANIDSINNNIAQIQSDITQLEAIAADNPTDTDIAGWLADAKTRLTNAQTALSQAQAALESLNSDTMSMADANNLVVGTDQNSAAAASAQKIADDDLLSAQTRAASNLALAKEAATSAATAVTSDNTTATNTIADDVAALEQLAKDYSGNTTIATALADAQKALEDAKAAQAKVDTAAQTVPGLTSVQAVIAQQTAVNSAGKDVQGMLVVANDAVTAARAEAAKVLADDQAAAKAAIQQQLDTADANITTIQSNIDAIEQLLKDNPGDADIQAALDDANAQLTAANKQLAALATAMTASQDATTPAAVQAARDSATAAASEITDATTQSTTDLADAQKKADANLAAAKSAAETAIGDQLTQVTDNIAQINDDIKQLTQIATDNPDNTKIAALLDDAKSQLATATTQQTAIKDAQAAIDAATTVAAVTALEDTATTATTTADTAQTTADKDLADAKELAAADLKAAQEAATTTVDSNIAAIQDQIDQITKDIATIQTLADNNPGDTTISDALTDAQKQLDNANAALTDANTQKEAIANTTTPAAVAAVTAVAAEDQANAEAAGTQSAQDVTTAQAKNDANLKAAQEAAKDAIQDNINAINDSVAQIATDVATLQTLADNNPDDQEIADKLADALTQQTTANDALTDAEAQLKAVDAATTVAGVDALTTQGQKDEDAAKAAADAVSTDVTAAQSQSEDNLTNAQAEAKTDIQANIDQIKKDQVAIADTIESLQDLVDKNPGDTAIADALANAESQKTIADNALTDAEAQLKAVDDAKTLADVTTITDAAQADQDAADKAVTDAQKQLDTATDKSANNLADAKTAAETAIDADIADIQENIDSIQSNVNDLKQIATDNPDNTTIADKLKDAEAQLADAQAQKEAAEAAKDAIADQTTIADVQTQTDAADTAKDTSDTDAKTAADDLADAQTAAASDLAADQATAQKAVDSTISTIEDQIGDIQDDIKALEDIASKNPDDSDIADKLTDAKNQLTTAETALDTAEKQKTAIEDAATPAEVAAAEKAATDAGASASGAKDAADQDVTDAQAKSDSNLTEAKDAADKALDQNIADITSNINDIQTIVDDLQQTATDNPGDTVIEKALEDAKQQLTDAKTQLADAETQKNNADNATTLADVQAAVDAGQTDAEKAAQDLENAQADQKTADEQAAANLTDAQTNAKNAINADLETIQKNIDGINSDITELTQIEADNPDNKTIQDKWADAQQQLTEAEKAQTAAQDALKAVDSATTPADVDAQEQIATNAVTSTTGNKDQADQDLADAKDLAASDLETDQAAAQTAVDQAISDINDNIDQINDDIAELTDIAANNPDDTTIADKLAKAKDQLNKVQSALEDARAQLVAIETAETPAQIDAATNQVGVDQVVGN